MANKIPKILDNNRKILLDSLIEASKDYDEISIATGYWDLEATAIFLPYLEKYKKIRLIIGQEPTIARYNLEEVEPDFPDKDIFEDLQRLKPDCNLKNTVKQLKELVDKNVLEVKIFKTNFLHAKCYIFGNFDSNGAVGFIGSSNFTKNGLTKNRELNACEDDQRVVQFEPKNKDQEHGHLSWFEEIWNDEGCVDWTGQFIELIDTSVHGDKLFTPYEMYIHTLYQIYKDDLFLNVDLDKDSESVLHAFQNRNARLLIQKLEKSGVAMLADSVGLGKTITAGAVINHYLNKSRKIRIEVIVPGSLVDQWPTELGKHFGINNLVITSFHNQDAIERRKSLDKYGEVDLFVIDEAHNLRKESGSRYEQMMNWIQDNSNAHVLLLTATPINNSLVDFAAQINIASGGSENLFKVQIPEMDSVKAETKDYYDAIVDLSSSIKKDLKAGKEINKRKIRTIMRPILEHFMVRSTRRGIEKEFNGIPDKDGNFIKFPEAKTDLLKYRFIDEDNVLINDEYDVDLPIEEMLEKDPEKIIDFRQLTGHPLDMLEEFEDKGLDYSGSALSNIFLLSLYLGLPIYRSTLYKHEFYGKDIEDVNMILKAKNNRELTFTVKQQMVIHNMMRTIFLKRTESSIYSLKKSFENYEKRIEKFLEILDNENLIMRISNIEKYLELTEREGDLTQKEKAELEDLKEEANENVYNLKALREDIEKDKKIIKVMKQALDRLIKKDDKVECFKEFLDAQYKNNKKVLVFSYFSDTVNYLSEKLPKICKYLNSDNSAFVSSGNKSKAQEYAKRFSPVSKEYTNQINSENTEIQFLFSTDVLSEGQNLQDASIILNYDLHWNPVRMIQRNGRINRLGSKHKEVFIYNMTPAQEIEEYLKLKKRLEFKIEVIKASIGSDQSILGEEIQDIEFIGSDRDDADLAKKVYSEDQSGVIEEIEEEVDIFSDDNFLADLRKFENDESLERSYKNKIYNNIPKGKWGVIANTKNSEEIPENHNVLVFSKINLEQGKNVQTMPLFISLDKNGESIRFVEQLRALKILSCSKEDYASSNDISHFDCSLVENSVNANILQIAEKMVADVERVVYKYQEKFLTWLDEKGYSQDQKNIRKAIEKGKNRFLRNNLKKLILRANREINSNKIPENRLLNSIFEVAQKILNSLVEEEIIIKDNYIIENYYAKF